MENKMKAGEFDNWLKKEWVKGIAEMLESLDNRITQLERR